MTLKESYYYFFYKIYKSIDYTSKAMGGSFWTGFKATLVIMALEIFLLIFIGVYYTVITKTSIELRPDMPIIYIPVLVLGIFNFLMFDINDNWKSYVKEFDQWPKHKNKIGSWIVLAITLFIIGNLILSFYLMSQIDWESIRQN